MNRVLVSSALAAFLEAERIPQDIAVELFDDASAIPGGDYAAILPHVAVRVGAAELDRLPDLRVIANFGVGYDNIDVAAAQARGVAVTNTPGVLTEATAELTWALILAVARRTGEGERLARSGEWTGWTPTQLLGTGLGGRTLGIVGAGRIGRAVGDRAAAFGMKLVYWNRSPAEEWAWSSGAELLPLDELFGTADVISLHLALAPETRGLVDTGLLGRMSKRAILINTARGPIVDEEALITALERGSIRAGLDVYAREPQIPERLRWLPNVVLLPHLGSATEEARQGMWRLAWSNLLAGVREQPLPNAVT